MTTACSSEPNTSIISNIACHYKSKSTLDDTLDVFPCHGVGGMVGMLMTGLFAEPKTYRAWVRFSGPGPPRQSRSQDDAGHQDRQKGSSGRRREAEAKTRGRPSVQGAAD
jgi:hypothetical protein